MVLKNVFFHLKNKNNSPDFIAFTKQFSSLTIDNYYRKNVPDIFFSAEKQEPNSVLFYYIDVNMYLFKKTFSSTI